jgi:hypothetical protein
MSTTAGIKLHKNIVAPLSNRFDGTPSKLRVFLQGVDQRATDCGWNLQLLRVDNQAPVNNQVLNLVTSHRMLSIENVRAHAATYIGHQTRLAQDSFMLYEFLRDSLTDSARIRISVEDSKYKINSTPDGPTYLKVVLMKYHVETNATNFHLRESLHRLPQKMRELESNVADFNDHVQGVILDLAAGGETSSDLIVYLFSSYLSTEDSTFKKFIERKREEYDEGRHIINVDTLMDLALTKYKQLNQSDAWNSKTPEEEQLITLTAQLKDATSKIADLSRDTKKVPASSGDSDSAASTSDVATIKRRKYPAWRYTREVDHSIQTHRLLGYSLVPEGFILRQN